MLQEKYLAYNEWFYNFDIHNSKHKKNGELMYKIVYEYYENINTRQVNTYNGDGSLRNCNIWKYSDFDKYGNWCTCLESNTKEEDKIIVEREIAYY